MMIDGWSMVMIMALSILDRHENDNPVDDEYDKYDEYGKFDEYDGDDIETDMAKGYKSPQLDEYDKYDKYN